MNIYTDPVLLDVGVAVEALPAFVLAEEETNVVAT